MNAGAYCERVDEQIFDERILDRIYNQIAKADVVIADMTGRNPNVFYEVGYAHALGKLTILLTQISEDIPFDLKHFPHIVYGAKISTLRDELEKRVTYFIDHPPTGPSDIKHGIELFLGDQSLASGDVVFVCPKGRIPSPEITVFNSSGYVFAPGDFKVGILTGERFVRTRNKTVTTTKLPKGGYFHMLPDFSALFPNAYTSFKVALDSFSDNYLDSGEKETVTVRLFTKQGNYDFPLNIRLAENGVDG